MKYVADPVEVDAFVIIKVGSSGSDGDLALLTEDGVWRPADKGMTARYTPQEGDYWVRQSDGYVYLNPKDVFERKYRPMEAASASSA